MTQPLPLCFGSMDINNWLEAFLRRAAKANFYSANTEPTFIDLCASADARLLNSIISNTNHVLHYLLPAKCDSRYNTRSRPHSYVLSQHINRLCDYLLIAVCLLLINQSKQLLLVNVGFQTWEITPNRYFALSVHY